MIFEYWYRDLSAFLTREVFYNFFTAILILATGIFIAKKAKRSISGLSRLDSQQRLVISKSVYYILFTLTVAGALSQLGLDLKVLLGAAGVLTVAVGFAAQTSTSNLVSGLFLMVDQPFVVGNIISLGDIRGEVISIDLLSCRIRTFNNLMVRVPNETMVKSNITNFSYFPLRRLDIDIGVAYKSDLRIVEEVLRQVATQQPLCLEEPSPVFLFSGFGDSAMNVQFQVWTLTQNLIKVQNELYREIKAAFDREGIEIPFPTRTLVKVSDSSDSTA